MGMSLLGRRSPASQGKAAVGPASNEFQAEGTPEESRLYPLMWVGDDANFMTERRDHDVARTAQGPITGDMRCSGQAHGESVHVGYVV